MCKSETNAPPPAGVATPSSDDDVNMSQLEPDARIVEEPVAFGRNSQPMICPYCHANISTRVKSKPISKILLIACLPCSLVLCLLGCTPCSSSLDCMQICFTRKHYCPSCKAYLGQHKNQ